MHPSYDIDAGASRILDTIAGEEARVKKTITVTVIYPVTFQTEIDASKELYELREQVKNEADAVYKSTGIDSVIHQCDEMSELVEQEGG